MKLNFGLNLKILREKAGMSQEQLGAQIGLKSAAISKYEKNLVEPKMEYLAKFAQIFGVTLDDLMLASANSDREASLKTSGVELERLQQINDDLREENKKLIEERDALQKRLITALERALKQK